METSSGSGSGSGSNNEKRGRKYEQHSAGSSDPRNTNSSGSDTVAPQQKRPASESPVDPLMFSRNPNSLEHDDHSPTTTLTTTISSLHKKDSRRESDQRHPNTNPTSAHFFPSADPTWRDTHLAPAPLRVSRPPSEEYRPISSDSTTLRAFHRPDDSAPLGREEQRPRTADSQALSFSYPGRLRRTSSAADDEGSRRSSARLAREAGRAF